MDELDLLDWKRRVFALYAAVRDEPDPERAWQRWRDVREELYRTHPQSPRRGLERLDHFPYDASLRVLADVQPTDATPLLIRGSAGSETPFRRFACVRFELHGNPLSLELYWLEGYGGGVFLPFGDETTGRETYGGGRYLLDTVKGSDLGTEDGRLVLDFNFAYNPSCAYDPSWACPLSAAANRLPVAITAGERAPV